MSIKNHYGIYIDTEKPVTGVWYNNEIEWLGDEIQDGIDLAWEEHVAECKGQCSKCDCNHPEGKCECHGTEAHEYDPVEDEHGCCGPQESGDFYIGDWKERGDGDYDPDPDGEYSAIVREIYTQVVLSKWAIKGNACSPCYPGQAEPARTGDQVLYAPPPDLLGDEHPRKGDVFKIR